MHSCYVFIYLGFTVCSLFFLKKVKVQFRPYKTAVRLVCKKSHNCLTMLLFIRRAKSLSKSIIKGKTLLFIFEYMFSRLHPHFFIHVQGVPLKMEIAIPGQIRFRLIVTKGCQYLSRFGTYMTRLDSWILFETWIRFLICGCSYSYFIQSSYRICKELLWYSLIYVIFLV